MKWMVYIIMMGMHPDGTQDTYLYTEPTHESLEACQVYVYNNANILTMDMAIEFDGKRIERVFCIEEQKFKEFMESQQGTEV